MDELDVETLITSFGVEKLESMAELFPTKTERVEDRPLLKAGQTPPSPIKRKVLSPQEQAVLNRLWEARVVAKRRLDDNTDLHKVTALKNEYLSAIDHYKSVYKRMVGE